MLVATTHVCALPADIAVISEVPSHFDRVVPEVQMDSGSLVDGKVNATPNLIEPYRISSGVAQMVPALPLMVLGMPKTGTSSLSAFSCGGLHSMHQMYHGRPVAQCIQENVLKGAPAMSGCGARSFDAFTQLDADGTGGQICYYPQAHDLEAIHKEFPEATFILNTRPVEHWLDSVNAWGDLRTRLTHCNLPDCPSGTGVKDEEMIQWYTHQLRRVRSFVETHPSHLLVEVDIEDLAAGQVLNKAFGIHSRVMLGEPQCR